MPQLATNLRRFICGPILDVTLDRIITDQPADWLPKNFKGYSDFLRACYEDARQSLTKRFGADETKWTGEIEIKATFNHHWRRCRSWVRRLSFKGSRKAHAVSARRDRQRGQQCFDATDRGSW